MCNGADATPPRGGHQQVNYEDEQKDIKICVQ
jgi:hypothetical protein